MSFSERLKKKILIDSLTRSVLSSMGPPGSGARLDKDAMRGLLDMASYAAVRERNMDLYVRDEPGKKRILVLDNELPIYSGTTLQDVLLRKSPSLKEMISIRNAIRILSDKDVVTHRRQDSVAFIRSACFEGLDLSFGRPDVEAICLDTARALEAQESPRVLEGLGLLCELLEYGPPPRDLELPGLEARGAVGKAKGASMPFGPMLLFYTPSSRLTWVDACVDLRDEAVRNRLRETALVAEQAAAQGEQVLRVLHDAVIQRYGLGPGVRARVEHGSLTSTPGIKEPASGA